MRWAGHAVRNGKRRSACRVLVGKPEVKRTFGRSRSRCEDNIKVDLQEVGCGAWIGLIWIRIRTCDEHL